MRKLLLFVFLLTQVMGYSQEKLITGAVVDGDSKEPLPGVSVYKEDGSTGAITDIDGKFEINAERGESLMFSFIGMKTKKVKVSSDFLLVRLVQDVSQLDEVTVSVGYYNVKKSDLTGSIAQVGEDQLEKIRTNSLERMMQGQVAGVQISESSEPGGGISISIRGTNSILGGTQPLYVVDGIPMDPIVDAQGNNNSGQSQSNLSFINPNDIEKIEVLKDAAATAIYGARGGNGVVVITTKGAKDPKGSDHFSIVADIGISDVFKQIEVLDGPTFESYMNQRALNNLYISLTNPQRSDMVYDGTQALTAENFPELATFSVPYMESTGVNTNWQDEVYRRGYSKSLSLAYRGGTKKSNLAMSLGVLNSQGVIINTDFNRVTFNMTGRRKGFSDKLELFTKTNASFANGRASSTANGQMYADRGVVSQALRFQPIFNKLEEGEDDGIYADLNEGQPISNPYNLAADVTDKKQSITFNQSIGLTATLFKGLKYTAKGAAVYQKSFRDSYYPATTTRGRRNNGEATQAFNQNMKLYLENNLRYNYSINDHNIDAIVIGTYEKNYIRSMFNKAYGFSNDLTSYYNFESASDILVPQSLFSEVLLMSGVFRLGYNYKGKYYIDLNGRYDTSSKFAENKKGDFFPSVALAYRMSQEDWMKEIDQISTLKLRASYGRTGGAHISPYQSLGLMTPIRYNFNGQVVTGLYESNLANKNLSWETTTQYNAGFDLSLYNSRLNFTFDAYYKNTYDLLQWVNLPASNGYSRRIDNFGQVENKGIEFTLSGDAIRKDNFTWNILATMSMNRNKLIELNSNLDYQLGPAVGFDKTYPSMFMVGQPLGIFWGAETEGIYRDWEEANNSGISGAAPGEIMYVNKHIDVDEAGNPLEIQQITHEDYVKIGNPNPDFIFSLTNTISYKNFDFSFLFTGQKGGDILWVDSWPLQHMGKSTNVALDAYNDSWKSPFEVDENGIVVDNSSVANMNNAGFAAATTDPGSRALVSDRQIYDGSFIKLKNLNMGYTINLKKKKSVRLYLSGNNLLTFSNYPGYDPEVMSFNRDPQRRGIDFGSYPGTRSYVVGLKFNY